MKKVKLSTVVIISLILALIVLVVFGIMFFKRQVPQPVQEISQRVREATNQPPRPLRDIYGPPSSPLRAPLGLSIAPDGRMFVADSENNQIQVFDRNGKWLAKFGKLGRDQGEFYYPTGVLVRDNKLYVADMLNSRIQILGLDGKYIGVIPDKEKHGNLTVGPLTLSQDNQGNMYVTTLGHEVLVFDKSDKFVRKFARPGEGPGEVNYPFGVAPDNNGNVWVADSNNGRIHEFDARGRLIMSFGGLVLPRGMAVDSRGRIYVVDTFQHKVFVVNNEGKPLFEFGERGVEEGTFNFPNAVVVDGSDRIYIADRENNRISVWTY